MEHKLTLTERAALKAIRENPGITYNRLALDLLVSRVYIPFVASSLRRKNLIKTRYINEGRGGYVAHFYAAEQQPIAEDVAEPETKTGVQPSDMFDDASEARELSLMSFLRALAANPTFGSRPFADVFKRAAAFFENFN